MKERIISGVIAALVFLLVLRIGGIAFFLCIGILALLGYLEFVRLNGNKKLGISGVAGCIYLLYLVIPSQLLAIKAMLSFEEALWLFMLAILLITVISKNKIHIQSVSILFLGAVYIGIGFHSMIIARWENGFIWALIVFLSIWMTDTGAYLTGKWFGKHKLWPSISPNKTIEGAVGGVVFAVLTSVLFARFAADIMDVGDALLLGLTVALTAQMGDLIQSAYKRFVGVKDSGRLLPGHGGVLDRCDSWLIVFPTVVYFF